MIPLSIPNLSGNEWTYVKDCLDTGWISSVGAYVNRFEDAIVSFTGSHRAIAAVNGTAALHMALNLVGVDRTTAVLVPNLTFVASLNAISYTGATPIVIDVDENTWQMDLDLLEEFLVDLAGGQEAPAAGLQWQGLKLAAIMPVHVLGNLCDMDRLMALAQRYGLAVVEDSTEALGSYYKGRHAGSFGALGTFSFNGNKIISTGGGGMIVTNDEALGSKAKHLTTTAKTSSTEYFHDEVGYNYRLVNVLAAIGVAQMEQLPGFLARKKVMDAAYRDGLEGVADLRFQHISDEVEHNCWLHTVATSDQQGLISSLRAAQIDCRPFWVPMNRLPMYAHCHYVNRNDVAGGLYGRCVSIPSSTNLSDDELSKVVDTIRHHYLGKA